MDVKGYATKVGRKRTTIESEVRAARVAAVVTDIGHELSDHFSQLVEIHAARPWLWPARRPCRPALRSQGRFETT
jgi:hypothetical protein